VLRLAALKMQAFRKVFDEELMGLEPTVSKVNVTLT
jgi:hypothetical protein